jgi:hypothetical protein
VKIKHTRLATLRDTQAIVDMAIALGMSTAYSDMPVDRKKLHGIVESVIIGMPNESVMIVSVDDEGTPVGFLAGMPFEVVFSTEKLAIEIGWFVKPSQKDAKKRYLELRAAYEEWARRKGFRYCQYAVLNPTEKDLKEVNKSNKNTVLELVYHRNVEEK